MPRNRAVALVIHYNQLLVMFRKNTEEFYVFPGGGVEPGESNEQAVIREIKEEASLTIEVSRLAYELHYDNGDIHYYFVCAYVAGVPAVQPGTNEYTANQTGLDFHDPQWQPVYDIAGLTLYPIKVRDRLVNDVKKGFSDDVVIFNLSV